MPPTSLLRQSSKRVAASVQNLIPPADLRTVLTGIVTFFVGISTAALSEKLESFFQTPFGVILSLLLILGCGTVAIVLFGSRNLKRMEEVQAALEHIQKETDGISTVLGQHGVKVRYYELLPDNPSELYKHNMQLFREAKKSYLVLNYHLGRLGPAGMAYSETARNSKVREEYYACIEREIANKTVDFQYKRIIQLDEGVKLAEIKDPLFLQHLRWMYKRSLGREQSCSVSTVPLRLEGTFVIVDGVKLFWQVSILANKQYGHEGFFHFQDPRGRLIHPFIRLHERLFALSQLVQSSDIDGDDR
jgi:hypothetical protein